MKTFSQVVLSRIVADVFLDDFYGADSELYAGTAFLRLWELLHELGLVTSPHKDCPPRFSTWHSVVYFASAGFPYTTLSHELQKGAFSSLLHKTPTSITFSQIVFYYCLHQTRSHFYVSTVQHSLDFFLQCYTSYHLFRHELRHSMVVRLPSSF